MHFVNVVRRDRDRFPDRSCCDWLPRTVRVGRRRVSRGACSGRDGGDISYALGRSASGYVGLIGVIGIAAAGVVLAARRLRRRSSLAHSALRELGRGLIDVAAFLFVALVVTVLELNELRHEAANALATPNDHG
jgi:hypothetical protein